MKIKILLLFGILLGFNYKVYADNTLEIKDGAKINDNTIVTSYNNANIYVETKKIEIENFETIVDNKNVYRKYVSLDDLVQNIPSISYELSDDSNIILIYREYNKEINGYIISYDTEHNIDKKTFTSILFAGTNDNILFGDETRNEVLTADAETLKINNKFYVSLRFVSEALGAEVTHKINDDASENVSIDFYSSENYGKVISLEWKNENGEVVTKEDIENSTKDSCFFPNFSYSYRKEGSNEFNNISNSYTKIYTNEEEYSWNINEKKLCSKTDSKKSLDNSSIIVKYRGVPVVININNLGISNYCTVDKLSINDSCDNCAENPKCGIIQGNYYCCDNNEIVDKQPENEEEKLKVMLITGHAPAGKDVGATGEAKRTREIGQIVEKYLKNYVDIQIFNRDVLGEDFNANNFKTSAFEYFSSCNTSSGYKYSKTLCVDYGAQGLDKTYDFTPYSYVLELHFNSAGGAGTFITSPSDCVHSSTKNCMQTKENADKLYKITTAIMKYMANTGIPYNSTSNKGIRDDWFFLERYIRVSTNHQTPASLMEVCALDHDLSTYEANKEIIGKSIARGIVEGLGLNWNE